MTKLKEFMNHSVTLGDLAKVSVVGAGAVVASDTIRNFVDAPLRIISNLPDVVPGLKLLVNDPVNNAEPHWLEDLRGLTTSDSTELKAMLSPVDSICKVSFKPIFERDLHGQFEDAIGSRIMSGSPDPFMNLPKELADQAELINEACALESPAEGLELILDAVHRGLFEYQEWPGFAGLLDDIQKHFGTVEGFVDGIGQAAETLIPIMIFDQMMEHVSTRFFDGKGIWGRGWSEMDTNTKKVVRGAIDVLAVAVVSSWIY